MSEQEGEQYNNKREDFKKYLNELGVIEALTNILMKLYELDERPTDPLDYIRTHMTDTIPEKEELNNLKTKYQNMITQIQKLEEENMNLAKSIKELEDYGEEISILKLVSDE